MMTELDKKSVPIFKVATIFYGAMALIGLSIAFWWHHSLQKAFSLDYNFVEWMRLLGVGVLVAGLLLISSHFFEDWFESFRSLRWKVMGLLGPSSILMIIHLALISAFGEEIFFRLALQPFVGLTVTSVLFGLLHLGPDGKISMWSFWAFIAGLLLGWVYRGTESLWPPVFSHFSVNAISIYSIRKSYLCSERALETPKRDE